MKILFGRAYRAAEMETRLAALLQPITDELYLKVLADPDDMDLQALYWSLSSSEPSLYGRGRIFRIFQTLPVKPYYVERPLLMDQTILGRIASRCEDISARLEKPVRIDAELRKF